MEELKRYQRRLKTLFLPRKLFPIVDWLPKYRLGYVGLDLICGLTLGFMSVPQSLAYAQLAGLPLQYGLYTSYVGQFVYALMGTALHINVGTEAVISLLTGNNILNAAATLPKEYQTEFLPRFAEMLALWSGIILLAMGILGLGLIINFFSIPVIVGYTSACSVVISVSQLSPLLGIRVKERDTIPSVISIFQHIKEINLNDFTIGLIGIAWLLLVEFGVTVILTRLLGRLKEGTKRREWLESGTVILIASRNFTWIVCATGISYSLKEVYGLNITMAGHIPAGIQVSVPAFSLQTSNGSTVVSTADMFNGLGIGIAIIPVLILISHFAIGRSLGRRAGYKIDPSQELIALGVMNVIGSFLGAYPTSPSFSRSALVFKTKPKSLLYNVPQALMVLLALYLLTDLFQWIPKAALSSMVICALLQMFEYRMWMKIFRQSPFQLIPLLVTFVACIAISVDYGVIIGLLVSAIIYLLPVTHFQFPIRTERLSGLQTTACILTMRQTLKYISIDRLVAKVTSLLRRNDCGAVVVDCTFVTGVDFTGLEMINDLLAQAYNAGHVVVFVGIPESLLRQFHKFSMERFVHYETLEKALENLPSLVGRVETVTMQSDGSDSSVISTSENSRTTNLGEKYFSYYHCTSV